MTSEKDVTLYIDGMLESLEKRVRSLEEVKRSIKIVLSVDGDLLRGNPYTVEKVNKILKSLF